MAFSLSAPKLVIFAQNVLGFWFSFQILRLAEPLTSPSPRVPSVLEKKSEASLNMRSWSLDGRETRLSITVARFFPIYPISIPQMLTHLIQLFFQRWNLEHSGTRVENACVLSEEVMVCRVSSVRLVAVQ